MEADPQGWGGFKWEVASGCASGVRVALILAWCAVLIPAQQNANRECIRPGQAVQCLLPPGHAESLSPVHNRVLQCALCSVCGLLPVQDAAGLTGDHAGWVCCKACPQKCW